MPTPVSNVQVFVFDTHIAIFAYNRQTGVSFGLPTYQPGQRWVQISSTSDTLPTQVMTYNTFGIAGFKILFELKINLIQTNSFTEREC